MASLDTLRTLVSDHLAWETNEIPMIDEDTTFESIGFDSLDQLEFVMSVEDHFKIEIDDQTANSFKSIGQILKYLESIGK